MNGQEYENGYFRGHTTTPGEREGARAAEIERQEKKNMEAWQRHADETARRAEESYREDARKAQQMREYKREQERKEKEYAKAQQQKKLEAQRVQQPEKPVPDNGDWSTGAAIFGFVMSAIWAAGHFQDAEDSTLMIIIAGILGGAVLGRFYQAIIGLAVVIFILVALGGGL